MEDLQKQMESSVARIIETTREAISNYEYVAHGARSMEDEKVSIILAIMVSEILEVAGDRVIEIMRKALKDDE